MFFVAEFDVAADLGASALVCLRDVSLVLFLSKSYAKLRLNSQLTSSQFDHILFDSRPSAKMAPAVGGVPATAPRQRGACPSSESPRTRAFLLVATMAAAAASTCPDAARVAGPPAVAALRIRTRMAGGAFGGRGCYAGCYSPMSARDFAEFSYVARERRDRERERVPRAAVSAPTAWGRFWARARALLLDDGDATTSRQQELTDGQRLRGGEGVRGELYHGEVDESEVTHDLFTPTNFAPGAGRRHREPPPPLTVSPAGRAKVDPQLEAEFDRTAERVPAPAARINPRVRIRGASPRISSHYQIRDFPHGLIDVLQGHSVN